MSSVKREMSDTLNLMRAAPIYGQIIRIFIGESSEPYLGDALRYLQVTQEGQRDGLPTYANVFATEHKGEVFRLRAASTSRSGLLVTETPRSDNFLS